MNATMVVLANAGRRADPFEILVVWVVLGVLVFVGIGVAISSRLKSNARLRALAIDLSNFGASRGLVPFGMHGLRGVVRGSAVVVFRLEVWMDHRERSSIERGEVTGTELHALPTTYPWTWPEHAYVTFRPERGPGSLHAFGALILPTLTDPELDATYCLTAHFPVAPDPRSAFTQQSQPVEYTVVGHHRRLAQLPVRDPLRALLLRRTFSMVRVARDGVSVGVPSKGLDAQDYEELLAVVLAVLEQVPTWEALIRANQRAAGYG